MRNYASGFVKNVIISTNWQDFIELCSQAKNDGYILHKSSYKIRWPFFWKMRYKAVFRKHFVYSDGVFAIYNPNDIELVKR
jgi:hypothetical protein